MRGKQPDKAHDAGAEERRDDRILIDQRRVRKDIGTERIEEQEEESWTWTEQTSRQEETTGL